MGIEPLLLHRDVEDIFDVATVAVVEDDITGEVSITSFRVFISIPYSSRFWRKLLEKNWLSIGTKSSYRQVS